MSWRRTGYDRRPLQARRGRPTLRVVHGAEIIDIYPPPKPLRPELPRSRRARRVTVAAVAFVTLLAGLVFAGAVLAHPQPVLQGEMEDALQPGEYVLTDSVFPALFGYGRGDIVMVRLPGTPPAGPTFPYRVVGLPGETIDLQGGHVLVNGHRLSEPYVPGGERTDPETSGQAHWVTRAGRRLTRLRPRPARRCCRTRLAALLAPRQPRVRFCSVAGCGDRRLMLR
jgi:signal peptidase I